jgi:MFS family permease
LETSCGIGLTIGPVLGSLLYEWLGYKGPFLFYGTVFLIFAFLLKRILPASVDLRAHE